MSNNIKLSVIVPVYNTGEYLHGCISSILNQTLREIELILVDDGSKDNSGLICDEYAAKDARIRVVHKVNEGVSIARNTALALAHGEYVGFVDSDDTIVPSMYARLYAAAMQHNADIAMCDAVTVYGDGRTEPDTIHQLASSQCIEKADWTPQLLMEMAGSSWRCIYRSALIQRHSGFPVALKFSEDRIFNIYMMGYATRLVYLKEAFYNRLIWEGSAVHRFHADYFETAKKAAAGVETAIKEAWDDKEPYQTAYLQQFIGLSYAAINNYFYKTSPWGLQEKFCAVKALCNDAALCHAIRKADYTDIRAKWILKKRVLLLCLCAKILNLKYGR